VTRQGEGSWVVGVCAGVGGEASTPKINHRNKNGGCSERGEICGGGVSPVCRMGSSWVLVLGQSQKVGAGVCWGWGGDGGGGGLKLVGWVCCGGGVQSGGVRGVERGGGGVPRRLGAEGAWTQKGRVAETGRWAVGDGVSTTRGL